MNDADDYARIKDAFLALLDLDEAARAQRLAEWEAGDPALAVALRRQLDAVERPLALLDRAGDAAATPALPQYHLVRELGRGGMGRVWLAERCLGDAVQQVALKQIAHASWDEDDRRRFERERRILAGLSHPNIAALVDGGSDAHGAPFLATVFVDGARIDRHVESAALPVAARVHLVMQVAEAVAYAHRRLVVHRDLKPANILVGADGEPMLLDFGVARLLGEEAITTTGPSQMTLRYAAPEQVRGEAGAGVGSDVYALGVLLYELLTGASPYGEVRDQAALMAAILREPPPPPSRRAGGLDGDLDAIVLKALRKRVDDRYAGADAFAADLQRWLAHEPVEARRGERGYRTRAWLRRRWPWLAAAAVLLATGVGLFAYDRHRTQQQLAAVSAERDTARAIAHYFDELFASATPSEVREGKLTARELLQRSVARLAEGDTANMSDDARASMYYAVATVLKRQLLRDEAATMYERAIALWRRARPLPLDDLSGALNDRATVAYERGDFAGARDWQLQALALRDDAGDRDSTGRGHLLQMLAVYQRMTGDRAEAVQSLAEAARILRAHLPESRTYYAVVLGNLASFALYDGDAEAGLAHARESIAQLARIRPERVGPMLSARRMEASALRELGRLDEAEAAYRAVIERARRDIGPHDGNVAESEFALAQVLMLQQRWDEAEAALREAESIHVHNGGENHPRALVARSDRSRILIAHGQWQAAIDLLTAVGARRTDAGGSERSSVAGEGVQLAYARCRLEPTVANADALRAAFEVMQRDPPLPRVRLAQATQWSADCAQRMAEH